jgi:hypothetical protein
MDRTESTVRKMLTAIEAPLYDIGVLSDRGMLPGLDSIPAAARIGRHHPSIDFKLLHSYGVTGSVFDMVVAAALRVA